MTRRIRDTGTGPGTLISEGCKIEGTLYGSGNFMINGEVAGDCDIDGTVTLAHDGVWRGTIKAEAVIVAGTIEGDIEARGRVEINATARISGTVSGNAIAVAEGAVIEGDINVTNGEEPLRFQEKRRRSG